MPLLFLPEGQPSVRGMGQIQKGNSGNQHSPRSLRSVNRVISCWGIWRQVGEPFLLSRALSIGFPLWGCTTMVVPGIICSARGLLYMCPWCPLLFTNKHTEARGGYQHSSSWTKALCFCARSKGQALRMRNVYKWEARATHTRKEPAPVATHSSNTEVIRAMSPKGLPTQN